MKQKVLNLLNKTFNTNLLGYTARVFGFTNITDEEVDYYTSITGGENAMKLHTVYNEEQIEKITMSWKIVKDTFDGQVGFEELYEQGKEKYDFYYSRYLKIIQWRAEMGEKDILKNSDVVAYNNAQNHTENRYIDTPINIPQSNATSKQNKVYNTMIESIEKMAKFYINRVSTYETYFITTSENKEDYRGTDRAYKYLVEENGAKLVEYKTSEKGYSIDIPETSKNRIYKESSWAHYNYDENSDVDNSNTYSDWYVRDDCSSFAKAAIRLTGKIFNSFHSKWLVDLNTETSKSLGKEGFLVYTYNSENDAWFETSYVKGSDELNINPNPIDMSLEFLEPGDMLVTEDHIEFYVGNNHKKILSEYTSSEERNREKKKYIWTDNDVKQTNAEVKSTIKGKDAAGNATYVREGTFSWGNVNDEFPTESKGGQRHYFYYDSLNHCFRLCSCGKNPNDGDEVHWNDGKSGCLFHKREYRHIWRKE